MNSPSRFGPQAAGDRLARAVGILAGRLAHLLDNLSPEPDEPAGQSRAFLRSSYEAVARGVPIESWMRGALDPLANGTPHPIDLLAARFGLTAVEIDFLLLAGMPEEHEGYSAVLRSLHPRGESRASVGLAAQLLFPDNGGRSRCRELVEQGTLFRRGIVRLGGDAPLFDRSVMPAESLWAALHGIDSWPADTTPTDTSFVPVHVLDRWLAGAPALRGIDALARGEACTISVIGEDAAAAFHRAAALVAAAHRRPAAIPAPAPADPNWHRLVDIHSAIRNAVPVLRVAPPDGPAPAEDWGAFCWSGPLVISGPVSPSVFGRGRPMITVPVEPLEFDDRRRMWSALVPAVADSAAQLASRYPLEPFRLAEAARDLELVRKLEERPVTAADVAESLRCRSHRSLTAGVKLLRPKAVWEDLVLPRDLIDQLHEAVDRLMLQSRVLEEWGFLHNRNGARGVRLLFAGPPGTGKTLSAEVLAQALGVDLLVVDVSRVVSKWVGETEKNLAAAFDAAENSQAVLLFDEADALFAKRTEVSDAHDRYANLETAYLLQRLERFEGLAILATNLRRNIDAAFVRRLEFVLDFSEPDRDQRESLWKRHVPADAPVDRDLNYYELAALYPVVGGVIRNAAVAAAFRAAADGMPLCREHFIQAIRREYEKAGKAFPGLPAGMRI